MSSPGSTFSLFLRFSTPAEKDELMKFARVVRDAVLEINDLRKDEILPQIARVREALALRGLKSGCHVGSEAAKTAPGVIEWYAGQLLNIYDNEAWFAMNSFINALDEFCPVYMCEGSDKTE